MKNLKNLVHYDGLTLQTITPLENLIVWLICSYICVSSNLMHKTLNPKKAVPMTSSAGDFKLLQRLCAQFTPLNGLYLLWGHSNMLIYLRFNGNYELDFSNYRYCSSISLIPKILWISFVGYLVNWEHFIEIANVDKTVFTILQISVIS